MNDPANPTSPERQWAMILHFSQYAGYVVPLAGVLVPVLIWQLKKAEFPGLDAHGKAVVNWLISVMVYGAVCFLLSFLLIGIPLLYVLGVIGLIFPVVGGIKAHSGQAWKYPLSLPIFR
jgi:uncharacterized Tic20 family protein